MRDICALLAVQCNYCQWLIVIRAHRNYRLISNSPPSSNICIGSRRTCNSSLLSIRRTSLKQGDYKASLHFRWLEWQLESPLQFPVECQGVGWGGRELMCMRQQHTVFTQLRITGQPEPMRDRTEQYKFRLLITPCVRTLQSNFMFC
jgi:hypothetical protein